ncbi:glycoside hydrolase family 13 protein [Pseudolysinimonas sp.]|uniref:glycoside hydrolase family 13 protein n=1 Tax=Pseudolysinimonas sp. TaxID=2680009 RepID=UPI00286A0B37|nr:glycoside hydrolase family 13 protein [Pseudolysinimonas sp.]
MTIETTAPTFAAEPHHDGSALYVSNLDPALGDVVQVRVRIPESWDVVGVRARVRPDGEASYAEATRIASMSGVDWWEASLTVENPVHPYRFRIDLDGGSVRWLNASGLHRQDPRDVDDFRLVAGNPPPAWSAPAVLYQVFPDRFARSAAADAREAPAWAEPAEWGDPVDGDRQHTAAQFYGGDLAGVEERLDHIQGLGATLLYLTPVFPARSNHRYDALSFDHVDPLLGGDEALVSLVEAAHSRGLQVIGDLTTNHCGDAHEWFRAAYGNPGAPESEFFLWLDDAQTSYVSWLGVRSLPKFNWASAELRRRFIEGPDSVVARYLRPPFAFDGWRIDVANMTGRYRDQDLNTEVRRIIRRTMTEVNPDTLLLGEFTGDAAADFPGDAWHGAMTYANFTRPVWNWLRTPGSGAGGGLYMIVGETQDWNGAEAVASHREFAAAFPWRVRTRTMNALDTHDIPRFVNDARPGTVPVAVGLAMTMPGIPAVWAGDEFGLTGIDGEDSRTPLPWDELDAASDRIALYRRLAGLRAEHPALADGGLRWLHASAELIAFARESVDEVLVIVAARSAASAELGLGAAELVVAEGEISVAGGVVTTGGAAFGVWSLGSADAPEWDVG